jgi:hypothetical protein
MRYGMHRRFQLAPYRDPTNEFQVQLD